MRTAYISGIPVTLRAPARSDLDLIFSSWLKSYRHSDDASRMQNEPYFRIYKPLVNAIVARSKVAIACNPDDHEHIYGYAVFEDHADRPILHWIYVKQAFRRVGIAKALARIVNDRLGEVETVCTFATNVYDDVSRRYKLTYDPSFRRKE